ncbi:MAG: S41 family peptidase [Aureispira sp.]
MKIVQQIKAKILILALIGGGLIGISTEWNDFEIAKNLELFSNIFRELNTHYVDEVDPEQLMETGVTAMLKSLDPYTTYIPADEVAQFTSTITGRYGGLGVSVIQGPKHIIISLPYEGGPGQLAGLEVGDKLVAIDGVNVVGAGMRKISEHMRGRPGTTVEVTIERDGKNKTMTVTREEISINNVPYYGILEGDIAYIVLQSFSENAGENVSKALLALKKEQEIKGIVLDLRGNTGGLLTEAVNVANVFLEKNQTVVQIKGRKKSVQQIFRTLNTPIDTKAPLAVLIDRSSASASEIVAGALQDLDRGIIVGQRSYGKGLVQNTRDLSFGAKLKMTTARYYIPSGRCIQALEYKNGKPEQIPDSLRTAYTTTGGRKVYGGGGIQPDVDVDKAGFLKIMNTFKQKLYLFDFAAEYQKKHTDIGKASQFQLTEEDFENFLSFLDQQGYEYKTETEVLLEQLEKKAEVDNYQVAIDKELGSIKKVLSNSRQVEIRQQKARLLHLLQRYIATRYYYERGSIEAGIRTDAEINQAREVLIKGKVYQEILATK